MRTCAIPCTHELALASACPRTRDRVACPAALALTAPWRFPRGRSIKRAVDGGEASEELGFKVEIDALLADGADGRVLAAEPYVFALPMKAAETFPSWSTSPCTLPRAAGCLLLGRGLRWLRARVWDPASTCREWTRRSLRACVRMWLRVPERGGGLSPACRGSYSRGRDAMISRV